MSTAVGLLAGLVLESGARWGEVATDWQMDDARAILDPAEGDPLLNFLTRARSGSKTSDLAGMAAAALIEQVPAGGRCYAVASDRDQARLLTDALSGFATRTPGLSGAISVDRYSATTPTGARLEIVPADAASSFGLRGSLFVVDELSVWPSANRDVWVSILSAVPKVPGARLVVLPVPVIPPIGPSRSGSVHGCHPLGVCMRLVARCRGSIRRRWSSRRPC